MRSGTQQREGSLKQRDGKNHVPSLKVRRDGPQVVRSELEEADDGSKTSKDARNCDGTIDPREGGASHVLEFERAPVLTGHAAHAQLLHA